MSFEYYLPVRVIFGNGKIKELPDYAEKIGKKALAIEKFQSLVSLTVKNAIEDFLEDVLALSCESYMESIREARNDYQKGNFKYLEEIS